MAVYVPDDTFFKKELSFSNLVFLKGLECSGCKRLTGRRLLCTFACNAKRFEINFLFLLHLFVNAFGQRDQSYFHIFLQLLLQAFVTRMGVIIMICRVLSSHVLWS